MKASQTERAVSELRLAMLEAAAPEALRHYPAWACVLSFAVEMLAPEQRKRLGRYLEILEQASVE